MLKCERVLTFLAHENHCKVFLCTKDGPNVNTVSREHNKRVRQSFLLETRSVLSTENREILNQNLSKNKSKLAYRLNSFIT